MKYISKSEVETASIAGRLAAKCENGMVLCLQGDLGTGKTVFARALIRHLCNNVALDVPSPTFTLVQTYERNNNAIWHFDLYRLEDEEEIYELGWEEAISDGNIVIIEWPERLGGLAGALVGPLASQDCLTVSFAPAGENENHRIITVEDGNFG